MQILLMLANLPKKLYITVDDFLIKYLNERTTERLWSFPMLFLWTWSEELAMKVLGKPGFKVWEDKFCSPGNPKKGKTILWTEGGWPFDLLRDALYRNDYERCKELILCIELIEELNIKKKPRKN